MFEYEKNPSEIYRQSFATIAGEAELERFCEHERSVVIRLIHACGMVDLARDVVISPGAVDAGIAALLGGAEIICDVEMVRRGIIGSMLPMQNKLLCAIDDKQAEIYSNTRNTTRSAGAVEVLMRHIPDSIIAIGNAPTALFHLLELLENGMRPPALIIGCPVGFVGAVESKEALCKLAENQQFDNNLAYEIPIICVRGRRGGSAMAAAAINGLAALVREKQVT